MSITKRTFLIVCSIISAILLALNAATYLLFRHAITAQLLTSQEAPIEANVQLIGVFTQTVDQLVYQYTSDEQLGTLLSRPVGEDELADFNTRIQLGDRVTYHLNAESRLLNNSFSAYLYINPELPVSSLFRPENTIPNVSRVFSGAQVKDETWYREALARTGGQYVFLDEDNSHLCFARKLQSSSYAGAHPKNGVGVLLGRLPVERLPQLLSVFPVTENSGFLLLNDRGEQVYCSVNLAGLADEVTPPSPASSEMVIGGERYLCTSEQLSWGMDLVFLTPYRDVSHQVWRMMSPYLLCSAVFLAAGILLSLILSRGLSRPVVRFTRKIEGIRDTRGLEWDENTQRGPREIRQLNRSFGDLIRRINALIEEVSVKENQRRESELRALQAQINPHFMLNAMNTVNYMALEREDDDIAATVNSIANLMRYSITEPDRLVTLSMELDNIREYISVYVMRFRQDIRLEILPGLPSGQVVIPKFTLQPLVENSIRHGITRQDPGITIRIRAYSEGDVLYVDVTDTGAGADADKLNAYLDYQDVDLKVTHGFGIRNVHERLRLRYGEQSCLRYFNYDGKKLLARLKIERE